MYKVQVSTNAAVGFILLATDTRQQHQWWWGFLVVFLPGCKHTGSSQCDVYSWYGDGSMTISDERRGERSYR